jgi:hypothetical protein
VLQLKKFNIHKKRIFSSINEDSADCCNVDVGGDNNINNNDESYRTTLTIISNKSDEEGIEYGGATRIIPLPTTLAMNCVLSSSIEDVVDIPVSVVNNNDDSS